jgi:hypothetical protein
LLDILSGHPTTAVRVNDSGAVNPNDQYKSRREKPVNRQERERRVQELVANPPPEIEARCVPGMRSELQDVTECQFQAIMRLRRLRGLTEMWIGREEYLLPNNPVCHGLVREFNEAKKASFFFVAAQLHDWLMERGVPVPEPILVALRLGDQLPERRGRDGRYQARRMVADPKNLTLSNREIARQCKCSEGYVRRLRAEPSAHGAQIPDTIQVRRGRSTYPMRRQRRKAQEGEPAP